MYVTLEEAKAYLIVEVDDDDAVIATCVSAAEETVAKFLNAPLSSFASKENSNDLDSSTLPDPIKMGILMYTSDFYENRGVMVTGAIVSENEMATRVLHFWRRCLGV